jgi:hypothetical protein
MEELKELKELYNDVFNYVTQNDSYVDTKWIVNKNYSHRDAIINMLIYKLLIIQNDKITIQDFINYIKESILNTSIIDFIRSLSNINKKKLTHLKTKFLVVKLISEKYDTIILNSKIITAKVDNTENTEPIYEQNKNPQFLEFIKSVYTFGIDTSNKPDINKIYKNQLNLQNAKNIFITIYGVGSDYKDYRYFLETHNYLYVNFPYNANSSVIKNFYAAFANAASVKNYIKEDPKQRVKRMVIFLKYYIELNWADNINILCYSHGTLVTYKALLVLKMDGIDVSKIQVYSGSAPKMIPKNIIPRGCINVYDESDFFYSLFRSLTFDSKSTETKIAPVNGLGLTNNVNTLSKIFKNKRFRVPKIPLLTEYNNSEKNIHINSIEYSSNYLKDQQTNPFDWYIIKEKVFNKCENNNSNKCYNITKPLSEKVINFYHCLYCSQNSNTQFLKQKNGKLFPRYNPHINRSMFYQVFTLSAISLIEYTINSMMKNENNPKNLFPIKLNETKIIYVNQFEGDLYIDNTDVDSIEKYLELKGKEEFNLEFKLEDALKEALEELQIQPQLRLQKQMQPQQQKQMQLQLQKQMQLQKQAQLQLQKQTQLKKIQPQSQKQTQLQQLEQLRLQHEKRIKKELQQQLRKQPKKNSRIQQARKISQPDLIIIRTSLLNKITNQLKIFKSSKIKPLG